MKHYCDYIPLPLAEKLKEKGMPVEIVCDNTVEHSFPPEYHCETIYADALDWLLENGVYISIIHRETSVGMEWYPMVNGKCPRVIDGKEWQHSAEKAIEMALTLIREGMTREEKLATLIYDSVWVEENESVFVEKVKSAIKNFLDSENPWHKASEELPPYDKVVIVAYDGYTEDCCFNHRSNDPEVKTSENGWCDVGYDTEPTHWMPIPKIRED